VMVTTDMTEKIKTCRFMLIAGINKTTAPVTNPDIAIHRKKKPGASISTTKRKSPITHQYQKTKTSSVMI